MPRILPDSLRNLVMLNNVTAKHQPKDHRGRFTKKVSAPIEPAPSAKRSEAAGRTAPKPTIKLEHTGASSYEDHIRGMVSGIKTDEEHRYATARVTQIVGNMPRKAGMERDYGVSKDRALKIEHILTAAARSANAKGLKNPND